VKFHSFTEHIDTETPTGREVTHPERGPQTFRTLVETMAGHDLNHLAQLEAIAAQAQS